MLSKIHMGLKIILTPMHLYNFIESAAARRISNNIGTSVYPIYNNKLQRTHCSPTNDYKKRRVQGRIRGRSEFSSNSSIGDLILIILYHIVSFRTEVEVAVTYYINHKNRRVPIGSGRYEPATQELNGLPAETR